MPLKDGLALKWKSLLKRYKIRIEQAEELKEFALAQQLRNILATEQEHAMDLKQALGK